MSESSVQFTAPVPREPINYEGKVCVVTGAANGIGMGFAEEVARRGAKVVLVDILEDDLEATVARIKAIGGEAVGYPMDVTIEEDWPKLLAFTIDTYGAPYLLYNNAGIEYSKDYDQWTSVDWKYYMEANVFSVVYGCNTFFPAIADNGGGIILTTASTAALGPLAAHEGIGIPYAPSKHACLCFMEEFALEMAHRENNIQVAAVMPCVINTDIGLRIDNPLSMPEKYRAQIDKIDNRTEEAKAAAHQTYEMLHAPKDSEVYQALRAGGVIEIEEGIQTILSDLDRGYFYIYTHPYASHAVNMTEFDCRLSVYKQPQSQAVAQAIYTAMSGLPYRP